MARGAPKGHPRYGGRVKGTPNRKTQDLLDKAKELGVDPFEVLLMFAAGDWKGLGYDSEKQIHETDRGAVVKWTIEPATRAKCASEACQYLYPKRKAIELTGKEGGPIEARRYSELSDEELHAKVAALRLVGKK